MEISISVMARKTGQIDLEHTESEPAYWGNVLEEIVAKEFQERTGKRFVEGIKCLNIHYILFYERTSIGT